MKYFTTHESPITKSILLFILAVFTGWYLFFTPEKDTTNLPPVVTEKSYTFASSTTVPVHVSGIVEAVDSLTVRAETAGTIQAIYMHEGSTAHKGTLLTKIDSPVLASQVSLQNEYGVLANLSKKSFEASQADALARARMSATDSSLQKSLLEVRTDNRVQESSKQTLATLDSAVLSLVTTLDFVDSNRSLFSSESLQLHRDIVANLYSTNEPAFLSNGILYEVHSEEDIIRTLRELEKESAVDATVVAQLSQLVDSELSSLIDLLTLAETDFLDRQKVDPASTLYASYIGTRSNTIASLNALRSSHAGLATQLDTSTASRETALTTESLAKLAEESAGTQLGYANQITKQQSLVSNAELGVVYAGLSLTEATAPFSGIISKVHVENGEYVTQGTALFTLVGAGAREIRVSVPTVFLPLLQEGAPFTVDGEVVGRIQRFAPVMTNGNVEVFIEFSSYTYVAGEVLRGELLLESNDAHIVQIPRSHLFFNSQGPYVTYESGETSYVTILTDRGDFLYVALENKREEKIKLASSIHL
jgi:multidrug efflux pump subunit AcrA (membrane-fusion protein)